jgi:hypothetical protein
MSEAPADERPGDQRPGDQRRAAREKLLNREAAEVYLLLDFLSGRADRSLRPTCEEQGQSLLQDRLHSPDPKPSPDLPAPELKAREDFEKRRAKIEADLRDPTQLVLRTLQIKYPIGEQDKEFDADAAFLMRARDVLNSRAAPATGASIAFTSMLAGLRSREAHDRYGGITSLEFANIAYPWLKGEAENLVRSIQLLVGLMFWVLLITVVVSSYTAWGKSLLDSLDAVRRDDHAVRQILLDRMLPASATDPRTIGAALVPDCTGLHDNNSDTITICYRINDIQVRSAATYYDLARWEYPLRGVNPGKNLGSGAAAAQNKTEQWATAAVTVLGNYIMPILYAFLGSLAFVLRRYYDRLAASMLSPRDRRANYIRLLLGTLIGGCIGLVYSGSGVAQTTGTLGLAVTLSTSSLAFLAGYGVEGVFKALDGIIKQLFQVNGTDKPT